ncbi:MAG: hypothetical protein PHU64_06820 [Candidatus Omnitrophica bacterium]|nr:hypothetical protein [Candidatus Omnitrophota bacterium]MDD5429496.1 hypothetical protein [Candidatus Omnitrophota bacterium]
MALFDFLKTIFNPGKPASGKSSKKKVKKKAKAKAKGKVKAKRTNRVKKKISKPRKNKSGKTAKKTSKKIPKIYVKKKKKPLRRQPLNTRKALRVVKNKEKEVGVITHYFGKISVGIIKLKTSLSAGDKIHIKGANDDFRQIVSSMQIDHKDVSKASRGDEIGVKVLRPVHENDKVYLAEG